MKTIILAYGKYEGIPQVICEKLMSEWVGNSETRSGTWIYCVSADDLHHVHMVLVDTETIGFTEMKKYYGGLLHFDSVKANKQQADDYINQRGEFEQKGETIEYICRYG